MKKIFLALTMLTVVSMSCGTSPQTANEESQEDVIVAQFACPMECEGDKTYDEAGKCPTCKMDLVAVQSDVETHEGHNH